MKLTDNIYFGKENELESGLAEGSLFIIPGDSPKIYVYGSDLKPQLATQQFVPITQANYDALVSANTDVPGTLYVIIPE